jgi:hypothetical protein
MMEFSLEDELKACDWICEKIRNSDSYAQNMYAALCNNSWQKLEMIPILKDEYCLYSWRYNGGIIAEIQNKGDYMNWYCSGIADDVTLEGWGYVGESEITDEIAADLKKLGWVVVNL